MAERISDERISPEFEARVSLFLIAFVADAVDNGDISAVSDSVRALNRAPRIELCGAELGFFFWVPADAGGIKDNLRAAERGEARAFRVPLIPADLNADARVFRIEIRETQIAGREIKLFVIERIVWNVHFAIFAKVAAIGVDYRASVVIDAGGAAFEQGSDDDHFLFLGNLGESVRGRARDCFRKVEERGVLRAAEVFAAEQFIHANDLRAARGGFFYFFDCTGEIFLGVLRGFHLHEADRKFICHGVYRSMRGKNCGEACESSLTRMKKKK